MKMKAKVLIGLLLLVVAIASIGIVVAHGTDTNEPMGNMGGMMGMGNGMGGMSMMNMMASMHREMTEEMKDMMNDENFRNEMIKHMEDCPMMKQSNSE